MLSQRYANKNWRNMYWTSEGRNCQCRSAVVIVSVSCDPLLTDYNNISTFFGWACRTDPGPGPRSPRPKNPYQGRQTGFEIRGNFRQERRRVIKASLKHVKMLRCNSVRGKRERHKLIIWLRWVRFVQQRANVTRSLAGVNLSGDIMMTSIAATFEIPPQIPC